MAKLNYWERREAQDMYNYMESAEKKADEIAQLYLKTSRYISTQADQIFDKYKGKYGLSESEARRLLNEIKDKTSLDELLQKLRDGDSNDSRKELRKQLESAAYQARLERLRQLQNQLDFVMMRVYKQELQRNRSFYTDFANEAYYREMYNIQQRAGAAFSFAHISKDIIDEVINSRWSGENYSSRIWKNTKALAQELKEQLLLELVTGKTHREIANEIANKYAAGASRARRLIRTESNYLAGEMSFKAYAAAGIEKYMYLAVLDLKTCTTCCRTLDGKIFYTKDKKVGVNCHPMHPWCRCTEIAVLDEDWLKDMTRKALDPKTHKKIDVPLTMSYAQWYQKYAEGNQDAKLEEKQIKNRTEDEKQWKKYKKILGKDYVPDNLDDFQKLKYTDKQEYGVLKAQVKGMSYYNRAIANEPAITATVKNVAKKVGADMAGIEYRIKSKESYLRKIRSNYNPNGNEYEVKDILRYTYIASSDKLTEVTLEAIESYRNMGYNTDAIKNYWLDKRNPYNGINTVVKATNGQKMELQYHTSESYSVKDAMHGLYEKWRVLDKSSLEAVELRKQMNQMSSCLEIPHNISKVK